MATSEADEPVIRVAGRRKLGANSLFDVYFDDISDANGHRVPDFLAIEPRVVDPAGVTGIAILPVRGGKVGLMQMFRHPYGAHAWEIPMGFIDAGESPERAAARELHEETGLVADLGRLVSLGMMSPVPSIVRARVCLYAVEATGEESGYPAAEFGHGGFQWIAMDDALALADRGEIVESCTLVSLYRFLRLAAKAPQ